ncbi:ketopantoate reductase family protein [Pyrodictium abyssi]|uniref:2-dehydropantoate 2-reductase n=1 Tax=Pyrodictium abyssi TaxID=54256 RepID=A0ABM8IZV4_9CREN|nr:2-dehydropantoate 2-reductase [Pyrodictium abyssi]
MNEGIAIVGCGPVGLFLAASIASAGYRPKLLCLSADSATLLLQREIRVHHGGGEARARVSVAHVSAARGEYDYVVVASRLNNIEEAFSSVKALLSPEGGVILVQPSPYVLELSESLGVKVAGVIGLYTCIRKIGVGEIEWPGTGVLRIAVADPSVDTVRRIVRVPGLRTEDKGGLVKELLWDYSIVAAALQPISAVLGLPYSRLWRLRYARELATLVAGEAERIAEKAGVKLWRRANEALEEAASVRGCMPRMLQDVNERRETEADYILGYFLKQAIRYDVYTPYMDSVYLMVKAVEEGMRNVA